MIVVGAAIRSADRTAVLAACRAAPAALAGRWELPGGKVEPGEDERTALVRECREELGVDVVVGAAVGAVPVLDGRAELHVWWAELVDGEPRALEHRELRWLTAATLDDVDWLDADLPLVPLIRAGLC